MTQNPVEKNFVTRFILGFAVIVGMMFGAQIVAYSLVSLDIPYGDWIGAGVGAVVVFLIFTVWYRKYDASFSSE